MALPSEPLLGQPSTFVAAMCFLRSQVVLRDAIPAVITNLPITGDSFGQQRENAIPLEQLANVVSGEPCADECIPMIVIRGF